MALDAGSGGSQTGAGPGLGQRRGRWDVSLAGSRKQLGVGGGSLGCVSSPLELQHLPPPAPMFRPSDKRSKLVLITPVTQEEMEARADRRDESSSASSELLAACGCSPWRSDTL